jgi:WD40 repeat protein
VWRRDTGEEVGGERPAHRGDLTAVAFAPRGMAVATASDDHTVRLWDPATGKSGPVLRHENWVRALAFSPDGKLLATSSLDDTVRLWDAVTGRPVYRLAGHGRGGGRRALCFSPDGKTFASWGDDMYLRVWDVARGKAIREHRLRPTGIDLPPEDDEEADVRAFRRKEEMMIFLQGTFSPDGKRFFLAGLGKFHVFDTFTGKELRIFAADGPVFQSPVVAPNGKFLAAFERAQPVTLKLWHLPSGQMYLPLERVAGDLQLPLAFSTDGRMLARKGPTNDVLSLVETATGKTRLTIPGLPGSVLCLTFSPGGRLLVSGLNDTTALVWDLTRFRK